MALAFATFDTRAVLYRKPWGAIALAAGVGIGALGFALAFYWLSRNEHGAPWLFITLFCSAFGLAGLAVLARLAVSAPSWIAEGGIQVAAADATGLAIAEFTGADPHTYPWSAITGIVLVDRLKLVQVDETAYCGSQIVVFLASQAGGSSYQRLSRNVGRSGDGRAYVSVPYPVGSAAAILGALRRLAPRGVPISHHARAEFNTKIRRDSIG